MSFFSRFLAPTPRQPLPTLEEILGPRGVPMDLPGLEPHLEEFPHLGAAERATWGDALQDLMAHGWPLPPVWLDAQYDLSPRLVPTWTAERDGLFYRPVFDGLSLRIESAGQTMPDAWLTLWGVGWEDVHERALDQLREASKNHPFQRQASGIYRAAFGDGHASARFLLPELWQGLFPGQNLFIALPAEDELLVAPQVLLPQLVEAIFKSLSGPAPRLMGTIYQQVNDHYLPANLQDPHPMAQPQRELRQADLMAAYQAQDDHLPADQGEAVPTGVLHTQQGRSLSYAFWKEGGPVLLPEVDLIGFLRADGQPLGMYFRQTLPRIAELHGTTIDFWGPRRIRYQGFPTAAQLARLESFATPEQMIELFRPGNARPRPQARPRADQASSASGASASPVPAHLRGLSLGVQDDDD
jgi:hypothetical protein